MRTSSSSTNSVVRKTSDMVGIAADSMVGSWSCSSWGKTKKKKEGRGGNHKLKKKKREENGEEEQGRDPFSF